MNEKARINGLIGAQLIAALLAGTASLARGAPVPAGLKKVYTQPKPHQGAKECKRRQKQMGISDE
jgi:hypothetical protein